MSGSEEYVPKLIVGETYTVLYDGESYTCVAERLPNSNNAWYSYNRAYIGNIAFSDDPPEGVTDTGEPFLVETYTRYSGDAAYGMISAYAKYEDDNVDSHSITVTGALPEVVTIDKKYLTQHQHWWKDIINRPFGFDAEAKSVIFEEQSVTTVMNDYSGVALSGLPVDYSLIAEFKYYVTFDGTLYTCTACVNPDFDSVYIGNPSIFGKTGGNEEPFYIESYGYGEPLCLFTEVEGTHTIEFSGTVKCLKKLDKIFLPEHEHEHSWNSLTDKPFGEVPALETVVDSLTRDDYEAGNKPSCNFVVGEVYTVDWNGVLYENLVCYDNDGYHTIGNLDEHPFCIDDDGGNGLCIVVNVMEPFLMSIFKHGGTTIKKIDPKYLPDGIGGIDCPVDSVNGKTGAVSLSASDVGAAPASGVAYIDENDNKIITLSVDSDVLVGGDL